VIAALLLGRKGSAGFPGKNTYPVLGRPMATYPMRAARAAVTVDRAYISTDDEALMELAAREGLEVILRPPHLATKEALGEHAYVHGYDVIRHRAAERGEDVELMVLLFCNAPTVTGATIDRGIEVLRANPSYDSAVTVSQYNMWSPLRARREDGEGLLQPFVPFSAFGDPRTLNCDRDSQGDVWFADMSLSIVRPQCLEHLDEGLLPQKWMGRRIFPLKQWGGLDVDFEWQIPQVEYWLRAHGVTAENWEPRPAAPATQESTQ
jgi:CMP-N-acetylneuraminic acid synthetase